MLKLCVYCLLASLSEKNPGSALVYLYIDLLQVDLLASGASLFCPRSDLFRREAADCSDEVARGRLVLLAGFSFAFHAKNGEWRDSHLGFQVSFASP